VRLGLGGLAARGTLARAGCSVARLFLHGTLHGVFYENGVYDSALGFNPLVLLRGTERMLAC